MPSSTALDARRVTRWRNGLLGAYIVGGITISAWGPRLPAIALQLQVTTGQLGAVFAGSAVGSVAGLLASAPITNRLGGRRTVGISLATIAVMMAGVAVGVALGSLGVIAVAFLLIGFATAVMDVSINVEGAALERIAGRSLMPFLHAAWSVGAVIGSGIGAGSAAIGLSPTGQFAWEALLIAAIGTYVVLAVPSGTTEPLPSVDRSIRARVGEWLRGWTEVRLLLIGVVMLGVDLSETSANNWLTLAVQRDHGFTPAVAALFFTAFAIGEAASRIFGGPVVDRLGRVATIRLTTAVGTIGLLLFILSNVPVLVLLGVLLLSVGVSMGFPLGMSAAGEGGGNVAARINVVASIGYAAGLGGPPVIGFLAQGVGLLGSFWVLVAMMVVAFLCAPAFGRPAAGRGAVGEPEAEPAG
ncbi:MAG: MFS transporter [Curtobacterium sp.]